MAIIYPEGTQSLPSNVIQIVSKYWTGTDITGSTNPGWHVLVNTGQIFTAKGNGYLLLQSSMQLDVNGGSSGHFQKWEYSTNNSNWNFMGQAPASPSNRVECHSCIRRKNGTDLSPVSHNIVMPVAAGTNYYFRMNCWLIPGAAQQILNKNGYDSDNYNNPRTTSWVTITEFA